MATMHMQVKDLQKMAKKHGWKFCDFQEAIGMVSFIKNIDGARARINIYTTKMTVATAIKHPKKGKTQLYRKRVNQKLMDEIFNNPRVHTHKGYRTKR